MLCAHLFKRLIVKERLKVIDADGDTHHFGPEADAADDGEPVTIRLHDRKLHYRLATKPEVAFGEAYMDGTLTVESGTVYDLLDLLSLNQALAPPVPLSEFARALGVMLRPLHQYNPVSRSRRNVAHHYDLSGRLYELFLDSDRQYSCAYFRTPTATLEQAQLDKKRHIAAKLRLEPGMRVLDIGCGWGGMALHLAREHGVEVLGVTLSSEQLEIARQRARDEGLDHKVRFELQDYRETPGPFERIVSVGMFEHVGVYHYRTFFHRVHELLTPDGIALLHSIGRRGQPGTTNAWIRKYIFPGGYIPALSEVMPAVEAIGLWATDIEILRLHYAETLRHWRRRFMANIGQVRQLYDDRFCRMWEFYLAGSEAAFRHGGMMVFQMQLARDVAALPLTRDYMRENEQGTGRERAGKAA